MEKFLYKVGKETVVITANNQDEADNTISLYKKQFPNGQKWELWYEEDKSEFNTSFFVKEK